MLKARIGIIVLAATGFGCFAAANASAAQRAFICTEAAATKTFGNSDCTSAGSSFGHLNIANGTPISVTSSNSVFSWRLEGALSGVETQVECNSFSAIGSLTNSASSVSGTMSPILANCFVNRPSEEGCTAKINLNETAFTTSGEPANRIKVTPRSEEGFGEVQIENCSNKSLNNDFPLTGTLQLTANGAELSTTHAGVTGQTEKLKFGGVKAGLESNQTMETLGGDGIALT